MSACCSPEPPRETSPHPGPSPQAGISCSQAHSLVRKQLLLLAPGKVETSGQSPIVLIVVEPCEMVLKASQIVIRFNRPEPDTFAEFVLHTHARDHGKCRLVAAYSNGDGNVGIQKYPIKGLSHRKSGKPEAGGVVHTAPEHLAIQAPFRVAPGYSWSEYEVHESGVHESADVSLVDGADVCDGSNPSIEV